MPLSVHHLRGHVLIVNEILELLKDVFFIFWVNGGWFLLLTAKLGETLPGTSFWMRRDGNWYQSLHLTASKAVKHHPISTALICLTLCMEGQEDLKWVWVEMPFPFQLHSQVEGMMAEQVKRSLSNLKFFNCTFPT